MFKNQNEALIRKRCLEKGALFEDPEFPAVDESLFLNRSLTRSVEWKRPKEICENPLFFDDGPSRFDVKQGVIGDNWFLAAVASLTQSRAIRNVLYKKQNFTDADYCGLFVFKFAYEAEWTEIVVDDRLPTREGKLLYCHSEKNNVFWSALLEKAYAKFRNNYELLRGGWAAQAMVDLTGSITERYKLGTKAPDNFFETLAEATAMGNLVCCAIDADDGEESKMNNGLYRGIAYTVTSATKVKTASGKLPIVRIRIPWGNAREWTGSWSEGAREWDFISPLEKERLDLRYTPDGEFWMSYEDFISNFSICQICPLYDYNKIKRYRGKWVPGVSAGGCRNFAATFHQNPQFHLPLQHLEGGSGKIEVLISLLQKGRRAINMEVPKMLSIAYTIYKVEDQALLSEPLTQDYLLSNMSTARSADFISARETTDRFHLDAGDYVIIPSTFDPNEAGEFLLRIFCPQAQLAELDFAVTYKPSELDNAEESDEDKKFRPFFDKVASVDGMIDAYELAWVFTTILKGVVTEFPLDICRGMIHRMDNSKIGLLSYDEFKVVYKEFLTWKAVFFKFDKNKNGEMDAVELQSALAKLGFQVSKRVLSELVMRYVNKKGSLLLQDFIACVTRLVTQVEIFMKLAKTDEVTFNIDKFLVYTI